MRARLLAVLFVGLAAAGAASAQMGGGTPGGGGGHGGHGRGSGHGPPAGAAAPAQPKQPDKPTNQVDIVGVVKAIDTVGGRITIAYEPVDELNWPAGTMPFVVAKSALLQQASVGQKVRFRIESQEITVIAPWVPGPPPGPDGQPREHHGPPGGGGWGRPHGGEGGPPDGAPPGDPPPR